MFSELRHTLFVQLNHFRNEQFDVLMGLPVPHCSFKETKYFYTSVTIPVLEAVLIESHVSIPVLN